MKRYFITSMPALAFLALFCITGCLKDKEYDDSLIQSVRNNGSDKKIIEIQLTATDVSNFKNLSFEAVNKDTTVNLIPVSLATPGPATEDIQVTLKQNNTLVSDYNTANGTSYSVPTSSMFQIINPGGVVTIPKGSHTGYLQVKINPSKFLGGDWALGYSIGSIDKQGYTISGNLQNGVVAIGIKNRYDGVYNLRGFHNRVPYDAPYNETVDMITSGPNSVQMYWEGNGFYHPIAGGTNAYGGLTVEYFFDLTTNALLSVNNPYTPGTPPFTVGPATTSRYDPATKTIYAQCYFSGNLLRMFTDTLRYIGPRP